MRTTSSSQTRTAPLAQAALRIVQRDIEIAADTLCVPQIDRIQLCQLRFPQQDSSQGIKRLGVLAAHDWLVRRRIPYTQAGGSAPYCFTIGKQALGAVSDYVNLPLALLRQRQAEDARLSFVTYPHRRLTAAVYVAFVRGCQREGFTLAWRSEAELRAMHQTVSSNGKAVKVLPDGFCVLENLPGGKRTACFLEIQVASDPSTWLKKAALYTKYWESGNYQQAFGYHAFRVLGITTSELRARHLHAAIASKQGDESMAGQRSRFWTSWADALRADVWGEVWFRADRPADTTYSLVGTVRTTEKEDEQA